MFKFLNREPAGYEDISPEDVHERLRNGGKVQLVDVRSPGEYKRGHIPKARLIPLGELQARAGELKKGHDIILYCQTASRSRRAAKTLAKMGYENVYNMSGGIARWPYGVK
jgi:rhodanese-related sulfurtransferase